MPAKWSSWNSYPRWTQMWSPACCLQLWKWIDHLIKSLSPAGGGNSNPLQWHSAWKIPVTEGSGGLQSHGVTRAGHGQWPSHSRWYIGTIQQAWPPNNRHILSTATESRVMNLSEEESHECTLRLLKCGALLERAQLEEFLFPFLRTYCLFVPCWERCLLPCGSRTGESSSIIMEMRHNLILWCLSDSGW